MRLFLKTLALSVIVGVLAAGLSLSPQDSRFSLVTSVSAQTANTSGNFLPEECNDPDFAANNPIVCAQPTEIGGTTVRPEDIQAAINSPTPNLANTTAYIFYTIGVILRGTVSTGQVVSNGTSTTNVVRPQNLSEATSQQGLIGGLAYLMGTMVSNPPASGQQYVNYLARSSRFAGEQAYAQGLGFSALNPILGTWVAFRDVAYYLLILMFFISGFLILIRHRISGQVAVTVQTVLPRLVITLILITFSYAIAGFIVEIMFFSIYFIINMFDGAIFKPGVVFPGIGADLTNIALNTNIFEYTIKYIFSGQAWNASSALGEMVRDTIASTSFGGLLQEGQLLGSFFEWILSIIFTLIFGIALLIAMFRTFFALLMSYAGFIINVVLSPFILLGGIMPNSKAFETWIRNLLGGLAPFVVAIFMIFMSLALTGTSATNQPGVGYRSDGENVSGLRLPLIMAGEIDVNAFIGLIGMGLMLLLPEAVNMAKSFVGAKGGVFDQYKDKAVGAFQKGWKGDKSIPFIPSAQSVAKLGARTAAGGVIGGTAAAIAANRQSRANGNGFMRTARNTILGGAAGAGAGAAILGPGIPMYQRGEKIVKTTQSYQQDIDRAARAIQRELATRRAKRNQTNKSQSASTNTVAEDLPA